MLLFRCFRLTQEISSQGHGVALGSADQHNAAEEQQSTAGHSSENHKVSSIGSMSGLSYRSSTVSHSRQQTERTGATNSQTLFEMSTSRLKSERRNILQPSTSAKIPPKQKTSATLQTSASMPGALNSMMVLPPKGIRRVVSSRSTKQMLKRGHSSGSQISEPANLHLSACHQENLANSSKHTNLMSASFGRVRNHVHSSSTASDPVKDCPENASIAPSGEESVKSFAAAYLLAVTSRDTQWASEASISKLLAHDSKLRTFDGQVHVGKSAVIKRLNQGIEQFVKMIGDHKTEHLSPEEVQAAANKLQASFEVKLMRDREDAKSSKATSPLTIVSSLAFKLFGSLIINRPITSLKVHTSTSNTSRSSQEHQRFLVTYSFKYGFRRLRILDTIKVKGDSIYRIRRSFKM